jgi:hypothetical protein
MIAPSGSAGNGPLLFGRTGVRKTGCPIAAAAEPTNRVRLKMDVRHMD